MKLSKDEWKKAKTIARALAHDTDRNELGKIVTYARSTYNIKQIMALVDALPRSGYVRSKRTQGYLQKIANVLHRKLKGLLDKQARFILGWSFRLLTTYQLKQINFLSVK
ncbi:MAG: hypothetical protein F6K39_47730 [Okeania sp. SIO3B3]|nr:hypothetical protein [Okeania sp. SIO3B3]